MDAVIAAFVGVVELATRPIPFLASSGILLLLFAALWVAIGVAVVRDPARLDVAWHRLRACPLPVQAIAWLLLLPVVAGLWVWHRSWPGAARLAVMATIASWNLVVLVPVAGR
jgi:hypothetical protein